MRRLDQTRKCNTKCARPVSGERRTSARSPIVDPSTALLAPEFVEALPRLEGTRLAYNHELNAELIYKLCSALIRAGVAKAEDWKRCGEDAITFAKESVLQTIGSERRELFERNVDFYLDIRDVYPEGYGYGGKQQLNHGALAVSISCGGAGSFRLGKLINALERESKGLGAAFYWTLIRSLNRVMRVYYHDDALYYEEMLRESAAEDDSENQGRYEFPEVKMALPECIRQTLDRSEPRIYRKLLKANSNGSFGGWITRLRRLEQLAGLPLRDDSDQIQGNFDGPPLPSLLVFFEERDAITACFDEEAQSMLEVSAEPALFAIFSPDKDEEVARAIAVVTRFVAFNAELFMLIEAVKEWEEHGRRDCDRREPSVRAA